MLPAQLLLLSFGCAAPSHSYRGARSLTAAFLILVDNLRVSTVRKTIFRPDDDLFVTIFVFVVNVCRLCDQILFARWRSLNTQRAAKNTTHLEIKFVFVYPETI